MLTYHRLISALKYIGLRKDTPALTFFGSGIFEETQGGIATLMGALLSTVDNVMLPAFTFSTMVIPESGPEENLIDYGSGREANLEATMFIVLAIPSCPFTGLDLISPSSTIRRKNHTCRSRK